ncbi:FAD-binding monooxygenase [Robbsia andropogonis]|uniref:FAD-binding monooxygenase n=1 Tax=Robbsia andropogonis TaxID=28092 RepID=A0A0F5K5K5_9BURK|nr:bifunctional 3-(3-hydroxy-phenyl)propionate/3-hydroxycinnamic acid hydroxylase [Robbsia andropogonis]KKB65134.1 FAD-binding monooxygenase [Robbsia andropogonis]
MNAHYDVLIVGFGPSGAVAANLLGAAGLRILCIDASRTVYEKPRAIAVDHEIMRVFQEIGIVDEIAEHIAVFPPSEFYGVDGQLIKRIHQVPEPYPLGYIPTMVFTQPPVEAALRAHAAKKPNVEIALGTRLVEFDRGQDAAIDHAGDDVGTRPGTASGGRTHEKITAHLRDDTGVERTVTAEYMIGCDGASSTVRNQLGIRYEDLVFDEPWLVIDMMVNESGLAKLPSTAVQYCEPSRPATYIVGPGRHRRWEIMLQEDEDPKHMQQEAQVWQLLSRWLAPEDGVLWRAASYRFHALVAKEWRKGNVFIAGDAAHQQPPFIGQGMCQGVRDVVNLCWKLKQVIRGEARDTLLDSYQIERSTHVRTLTSRIKALGQVICERDLEKARLRDARLLEEAGGVIKTVTRQEIVPPLQAGLLSTTDHLANGTLFPQPRIRHEGKTALFDTVIGDGWRVVLANDEPLPASLRTLLSQRHIRIAQVCKEREKVSVEVEGETRRVVELDRVLENWFAKHACTAAIVRPDHYVYGVAEHPNELVPMLEALSSVM